MIRPNTRLLVMAHGSNVSGAVQDAQAVGDVCRRRGVPFVLDAAQTAGHWPIDFEKLGLSALSVPGHKGLMGPSGTGALLLVEGFRRSAPAHRHRRHRQRLRRGGPAPLHARPLRVRHPQPAGALRPSGGGGFCPCQKGLRPSGTMRRPLTARFLSKLRSIPPCASGGTLGLGEPGGGGVPGLRDRGQR